MVIPQKVRSVLVLFISIALILIPPSATLYLVVTDVSTEQVVGEDNIITTNDYLEYSHIVDIEHKGDDVERPVTITSDEVSQTNKELLRNASNGNLSNPIEIQQIPELDGVDEENSVIFADKENDIAYVYTVNDNALFTTIGNIRGHATILGMIILVLLNVLSFGELVNLMKKAGWVKDSE